MGWPGENKEMGFETNRQLGLGRGKQVFSPNNSEFTL